jgi:hypothetical protein
MAYSVELCRDTVGKAVLGIVPDHEPEPLG